MFLLPRRTLIVGQSCIAEQVGVYAHVYHVHFYMVEPGKHVDGGASGKEVEHHLLRDLRRIGAYPFRSDAVIRGKDVDRFANRGGEVSLADGKPLRRKLFQTSQAAERLGERVEVCFGLGQIGIRRRDN